MPLGNGDSAMGGEKESNSAFNGLLRGHAAMLRGDMLQGHRADLNNFVNGVARVASFRDERVLGGPRKDLPQPDGARQSGFWYAATRSETFRGSQRSRATGQRNNRERAQDADNKASRGRGAAEA